MKVTAVELEPVVTRHGHHRQQPHLRHIEFVRRAYGSWVDFRVTMACLRIIHVS